MTEKIHPNFSAQGLKSAAKKLDVLALSDNECKAYERYEENSHYETSMHESHYGRGKLDRNIEIAINMLKASKPLHEISLFTGLSMDELCKLNEDL